MKNLQTTILNGKSGISKEARGIQGFMEKLYPWLAAAGGAAVLGKEFIEPMGQRIVADADHSKVLKRIKENYKPEKHEMLAEVFGVLTHTAPHMARNYLIAKTLVDQKMDVMEQLSGSHPAGVQIPLPTLEQAINMEKGVAGSRRTEYGPVANAMGKNIASYEKGASEDVEESYEDFLKGLL